MPVKLAAGDTQLHVYILLFTEKHSEYSRKDGDEKTALRRYHVANICYNVCVGAQCVKPAFDVVGSLLHNANHAVSNLLLSYRTATLLVFSSCQIGSRCIKHLSDQGLTQSLTSVNFALPSAQPLVQWKHSCVRIVLSCGWPHPWNLR